MSLNKDGVIQARAIWVLVNKNLKNMERSVLELMRHPDTTPEQLLTTHESYKKVHADIVAMQAELEKTYPTTALLIGAGRAPIKRSLWDRELL